MYRLIISDFITRPDYVHWADLLTLRVLAWLKGLKKFFSRRQRLVYNELEIGEQTKNSLLKRYQSPPEFE